MRRPREIVVRLTEDEFKAIDAKAKQLELTVPDYLIKAGTKFDIDNEVMMQAKQDQLARILHPKAVITDAQTD